METVLNEGSLQFTFQGRAVKFDEEPFYQDRYKKLTGGKGVDFISASPERICLIEVKDCFGKEAENRWRILPDNTGRSLAPPGRDVEDRDSLDIEVTKKVASTLSCLYGAWTNAWRKGGIEKPSSAETLADIWNAFTDCAIPERKKRLVVILVLEGRFDETEPSGNRNARRRNIQQTRREKAVLDKLQDDIKNKLPWLDCRVSVVNIAAANENQTGFTIERRI